MSQRPSQSRVSAQSPPVMTDPGFRITTTNENWRGKNDPAERRRIQNRLNQRAFRERQRTGETAKEFNPRAKASASTSPQKQSASDNDDDNKEDDEDEDEEESDDEDESENEDEDDDDDEEESSSEEDDDDDDEEAEQSNPGSPPPTMPVRPHFTGQVPRAACTSSTPSTDNPWDELAQLINRNFMQAASTNAQHLGLNLANLRGGTATKIGRAHV